MRVPDTVLEIVRQLQHQDDCIRQMLAYITKLEQENARLRGSE